MIVRELQKIGAFLSVDTKLQTFFQFFQQKK